MTLRAVAFAILLMLALWAAVVAVAHRQGVAVLGDLAPEVATELAKRHPAVPMVPEPDARIRVYLVTDWAKLAFIPGVDCGASCSGDARLVRIVEATPRGRRVMVFVNIADFLNPAVRDSYALSASGAVCLQAILAAEIGDGPAAGCLSGNQIVSAYRVRLR